MQEYLFLLGSTPELSFAELQAIFGQKVRRFHSHIAIVSLDQKLDAVFTLKQLGGTIKIAQIFKELSTDISENDLQAELVAYFLNLKQNRIHFSLGEIGRDHLEKFDLVSLKDALQEQGLKVRFSDRARSGASAALLLHRRELIDILLAQGESLLLARTLAVQDIDDWTLRDRGKPYADRQKGMLPPKLARIMVNLAVGPLALEENKVQTTTLYDPFCGTGTILLEAAFYPLAVFGSDLDIRAVLGARENLDWWSETYQRSLKAETFATEVTKTTPSQLKNKKINFLVTEPFLGKQTPKSSELPGIFRGLGKLYLGAFRHWSKILASQAQLVVIFPRVKADNGQLFSLDFLFDKLAPLGYNKRSSGLFYARPQAIIEREIVIFQYQQPEIER